MEDVTNFTVQVEQLYAPPDDPLSLTVGLTVQQGTHKHNMLVPYDRLDQLDIQKEIPGCVHLTRSAKSYVSKSIRLAVAQALQSADPIGELYPQSGWYDPPSERIFVAGGAVISKEGMAAPANAVISRETALLHLA